MRKISIIIVIVSLICFISMGSFAKDFEIQEIKALYAETNELIKNNKTDQFLLYATSDDYSVKKWNKLPSSNEKDLVKQKSTYKAWVYLFSGKIIKVTMFIDSLSGDWEHTTEHYFYSNGKIAFIFDKHFTFLANLTNEKGEDIKGPFIVEKRVYYNHFGKQIKSLEKAFILATGKEVLVDAVQQIEPDFYYDVKSLPFVKLITQQK